MTVTGFWQVFGIGCFGGALAELVRWYGLRESEHLPAYARHPLYWILTAAMVAAGGVLATLYGTVDKTAVLVANIGLSAPLIIKTFASTNPLPPAKGGGPAHPRDAHPPVREFLAGR